MRARPASRRAARRSGATTTFPWLIGSELVPYPLEVKTFVDYLKKTKPNATIAVLKANDDFGQSYADTLTELVKGTQLKVVKTEEYDNTGAEVKTQVNSLAATHADAFLLGGGAARVPGRAQRGGRRGLAPDHVHVGHVRVEAAVRRGRRRTPTACSRVTPLLDPADPDEREQPGDEALQGAGREVLPEERHRERPARASVAYGWTTAALLVKTLEAGQGADRASVMEAARTLDNVTEVGLQLPGSKWNTNADDWFIGETFQFVKYDATAQPHRPGRPAHRRRRQDRRRSRPAT